MLYVRCVSLQFSYFDHLNPGQNAHAARARRFPLDDDQLEEHRCSGGVSGVLRASW
jgi:hypothetical protein